MAAFLTSISFLRCDRHPWQHVRTSRTTKVRAAPFAAAEGPLPLREAEQGMGALSHASILSHVAAAIAQTAQSAQPDSPVKLTVDFPAERSERSAGTLVSRFENNLNFMERLVAELGGVSPRRVGGVVDIRDNVNPQGGGEYLSDDEVIVGLRAESAPTVNGRPLVTLLNAGVDAATLGGVRELDNDPKAVLVLINCGLGRLSWFSKLSLGNYFDDYVPAYYLKNLAGNGWMLKRGLAPWQVFADLPGGTELIWETDERPSVVDAEAELRLALAGIRRENPRQ